MMLKRYEKQMLSSAERPREIVMTSWRNGEIIVYESNSGAIIWCQELTTESFIAPQFYGEM